VAAGGDADGDVDGVVVCAKAGVANSIATTAMD
jgi:hypothetical protein